MSFRTLAAMLIAVMATGCSQQDKKPRLPERAVVGLWVSDTLAATDGTRQIYRLRMEDKGMAEFITTVVGGRALREGGTWDGADSLVRVVVRAEGTASRPTSMLFAIRGQRELGLVRYDTTAWGARGLTLYRQRVEGGSGAR
jgi:hypothetical protein